MRKEKREKGRRGDPCSPVKNGVNGAFGRNKCAKEGAGPFIFFQKKRRGKGKEEKDVFRVVEKKGVGRSFERAKKPRIRLFSRRGGERKGGRAAV